MRILLRENGDLTVVEADWVSACYDDKNNDVKGISISVRNSTALFCPDIPEYEGKRMVEELFRSNTADWSRTGYNFQWEEDEQEEDKQEENEQNCEDEQEEDKQDFEYEDYWK